MYKHVIRPLLFLFPSERAHHVAMGVLVFLVRIPVIRQLIRVSFAIKDPGLARTVCGLQFPNPLGIAAGFDKNGTYIAALSILGFGHIEVGSVTPRPQTGNPQPRLFRLKRSHALINRMGFNNDGCEVIAQRLQKYAQRTFILGANIGKNKDTPNTHAVDDYLTCIRALHPHVDYFVINVSSPNTPGLRALQEREPLKNILQEVRRYIATLTVHRPVLLKIAPDLNDHQLDDIIGLAQETDLDGLVICNTTLSRDGLREAAKTVEKMGAGGLSGAPLRARAQEMLTYVRARLPGHIPVIGVGGIDSAIAAQERLNAGAALVQIYTGFIYAGPGLVRRILRALSSK